MIEMISCFPKKLELVRAVEFGLGRREGEFYEPEINLLYLISFTVVILQVNLSQNECVERLIHISMHKACLQLVGSMLSYCYLCSFLKLHF